MKKINYKLLLTCVAFLFAFTGKAQRVTTIVGNGTAGYSGDGGQATAAEISSPGEIAIDATGNLYIADAGNNRIRKVNTSGVISTIAGNGTAGFSGDGGQATAAELSGPSAVMVDASGNLYIVDASNNRIRKVNTSGVISTIAGNGTAGYSGDGGQATAAELSDPQDVVLDASGNLYISDFTNHCIRKVNTSGVISTIAGTGTSGYSGDGGQATAAKIAGPSGVNFDASGNLYIADRSNNRIRMVNTSGVISTICGNGTAGFSGDGGQATSAVLSNPTLIDFDGAGNLYVTDRNNNRIRKIYTSGVITTVAGNGTAGYSGDGGAATAAEFSGPAGIVDNMGNLYIGDRANNRVRKITYSQTFYFQTISSGNFSDATIWQASQDGSTNWAPVLNPPNYRSSGIVISTGDSVVFNSTDTLDQVTVNGVLNYGTGCTLQLNNGTGVDLAVTSGGKFYDNGDNAIVWNSATWSLAGGAYLIRTRSTSSDNFRDQYDGGISTIPASSYWIVRKTGSDNPTISSLSSMNYGNLYIENTTGTTWVTPTGSSFTGSSSYPTIKGNMSIGGTSSGNVSFLDTNTNAHPILIEGNFTVKSGSTFKSHGTGFEVQGSMTLSGTVDYGTSGLLSFSGSGNQTISGTSLTFTNLHLNKSNAAATVTLSSPATVVGTFTFTNGIMQTDTVNLLTFNPGSASTGVNDSSFVSGPVKKIGNTAFTFPLGKGNNAQTIAISAPTYTTDAFQAEYFNTDPTALYGSSTDTTFNYVSTCQYFNLQRKVGTSNIKPTLSYDLTSCIVNMVPDPRVIGYNGTKWKDLGESNFMYSNFGGTISTATTVTQYGAIALGNNSTTAFNPLDTTFQLANAGPCGAIFMSEYVQDTLGNNAIEIYNPTSDTVHLIHYYLSTTQNSSTTATPLQFHLSGNIAPHKTFVVVNENAPSSVLLGKADQLFKNFSFNGKDAITLEYSTNIGVIIDKIGDYNIPYTDSGWVVSGQGHIGTTKNHTLTRLMSVSGGNVEWSSAQSEWYTHPLDTFSFLGWHNGVCSPEDDLPVATFQTSYVDQGMCTFTENVNVNIKVNLTGSWANDISVYADDVYNIVGTNYITSCTGNSPQASNGVQYTYGCVPMFFISPSGGNTVTFTQYICVTIQWSQIFPNSNPHWYACFGLEDDQNPNGPYYTVDVNNAQCTLDITGCVVNGIKNMSDNKQINVYPNPFNDQITIENNNLIIIDKITITDLLGREVMSSNINQSGTININTQGIGSGVYFIKVYNNNANFTVKLIKE